MATMMMSQVAPSKGEHMEVGIRELRNHLSRYLDEVRNGEEIVVTDRGRAVARLVPLSGERKIDRLIAEGRVTPAENRGPRTVPKPVPFRGSVSDLLRDERR